MENRESDLDSSDWIRALEHTAFIGTDISIDEHGERFQNVGRPTEKVYFPTLRLLTFDIVVRERGETMA